MFISSKKIEVRYAETDQMGVVYHANYLIWMELGRTKLIEDLGFNYAEMEKDGVLSPVIDIQASYKHPVRYGEEVEIKTWIAEYDGIRVTYHYEVYNSSEEIALIGSSKHVCVKKENFRPIAIKRMFPEWHEAYKNAMAKSESAKR
ncbi:thioesterase family protein [Bacillus sp. B15-48]|uniref:acyl-CoA thioesterase n=1 Tax=Bacillus sp. B15-48 TaxID=1548601 RepID=UPI00193EF17A|nr:thioesterase family protein [Bacillus sp. B15-48]MBM4763446.1 YbgC/FadM family acyl-CoA thioesterase [Bacillus sp. B15-48]